MSRKKNLIQMKYQNRKVTKTKQFRSSLKMYENQSQEWADEGLESSEY